MMPTLPAATAAAFSPVRRSQQRVSETNFCAMLWQRAVVAHVLLAKAVVEALARSEIWGVRAGSSPIRKPCAAHPSAPWPGRLKALSQSSRQMGRGALDATLTQQCGTMPWTTWSGALCGMVVPPSCHASSGWEISPACSPARNDASPATAPAVRGRDDIKGCTIAPLAPVESPRTFSSRLWSVQGRQKTNNIAGAFDR